MLYLQSTKEAIRRIENKEIKVCVVGVGTIGLPLATFLASTGFKVSGLDVNSTRVKMINSSSVPFEYLAKLKKVISNGKLHATINPVEAMDGAEAVFVCVPTPLDHGKAIDLSKLAGATDSITKYLKRGMMIIFESSVSVGATREMGKKMESSGLVLGRDFGLAYCPERYNPSLPTRMNTRNQSRDGIKAYTLDKVSRVVGGINEKSRKLTKMLYSQFITTDVKELSSIEAAEATKLTENIFRDVNIALVNELAKIYPKMGLNVYEIIDAAKTKPFAFMPHYPGAGVGGECIPVDTWYLIRQAESMGLNTALMTTAREVNDSMPKHVVEIVEEELAKVGKEISTSKILVLGIAYKRNIPDTRLSPALVIVDILRAKGSTVSVCDPIVEEYDKSHNLVPLTNAFQGCDAALLVTDHDVFSTVNLRKIKEEMRTPIIVDGRNFFDKERMENIGFSYVAVGKPARENRILSKTPTAVTESHKYAS